VIVIVLRAVQGIKKNFEQPINTFSIFILVGNTSTGDTAKPAGPNVQCNSPQSSVQKVISQPNLSK